MSGDVIYFRRNKDERENFANNNKITEKHSMKTNQISRLCRVCGATIALALFTGIGGLANAQDTGSAKGGATKQLELSGTRVVAQSEPDQFKPMTCMNCNDKVVQTRANLATKGGGAMTLLAKGIPTRDVSTHQCEACGTKWTLSGHGKAKVRTATHTCASCGA